MLARAKAAGLDVTAGVNVHHLTLNELDVGDYRTFFKLKPPLRSEDDRVAMVEAVASGLIDVISSMHTPQDEESKRLPFEEAASGAVGLETLLPAALRLVHAGAIDACRCSGGRCRSTPPAASACRAAALAEGAPADLVLFDADAPFVLSRFDSALEVEEHALRRGADAGPGAGHLGRRRRGCSAGVDRVRSVARPRARRWGAVCPPDPPKVFATKDLWGGTERCPPHRSTGGASSVAAIGSSACAAPR